MKYRLNFDWNGYKKGHYFEAQYCGLVYTDNNTGQFECYDQTMIKLLLLSGALTEVEVEEPEPQLPEEIDIDKIGTQIIEYRKAPFTEEVIIKPEERYSSTGFSPETTIIKPKGAILFPWPFY